MRLLALVSLLSACAAPASPVSEEEQASWSWFGSFSNWAGNVRCRPARAEKPRSLSALQAAVRSASHVRAVGAGHSWSALACSDELMLDTTALDRVLQMDATTVTVEAGITLADLDRELARNRLALA